MDATPMFAFLSLAFFSFTAPSLAQSDVVDSADYPTRIPGQCADTGQFDCGNGSCIPLAFVRDCVVNCPDGSDEECGVNQVLCDNNLPVPSGNCGLCVNNTAPALATCRDRQWAAVCEEPNVWRCQCTLNCVDMPWVLDGTDDCGDGSDENPCIANRTNGCSTDAECVFDPISLNHTCECRSGYVPFASLCFPPLGVTITTPAAVSPSQSCDFQTLPTAVWPTTTTASVADGTTTNITTATPIITSTLISSLSITQSIIRTSTTAITTPMTTLTSTSSLETASITPTQTIAATATQMTTTAAMITTAMTQVAISTSTTNVANSTTNSTNQICSGKYQCANGNCVNDNLVLNGFDNCGDDSDEDFCKTRLTTCTEPPSTNQCAYSPISHSFACGCPSLTQPNASSLCVPVTDLPFDCGDVLKANVDEPSGMTLTYDTCIAPTQCERYFLCDQNIDGGGWTTIQHKNSSGNFSRTWQEYKDGFGRADKEDFWLGNELIHHLTSTRVYELLIMMGIPLSTNSLMVKYNFFQMGDETSGYQLTLGNVAIIIGTNANDLYKSNGAQFSTMDRGPSQTCALIQQSGWWFDTICSGGGDLNVPIEGEPADGNAVGITWGGQQVSGVAMLIREKTFPIPPEKEGSVLAALGISVHSSSGLLVGVLVAIVVFS